MSLGAALAVVAALLLPLAAGETSAEAVETLRNRQLTQSEIQTLVKGQTLIHSGKVDEAERLTRRVIDAHPADSTALSFSGLLASSSGKPEVAVKALEQALMLDGGTSLQLQLALVRYHIDAGNAYAARCVADRVALSEDTMTEAERGTLRGLVSDLQYFAKPALNALTRALDAGDVAAAAPAFEVVLRLGPEAVSDSIEHLITRCEFHGARALLRLAVARGGGGTANIAFNLARVNRFLGNEEEALEAAEDAMQLSTKEADRRHAATGSDIYLESLKLLRRYHEAFELMRNDFVERGPRKVVMNDGEGFGQVTIFKLDHDAEQLQYLKARGLLNASVPVARIVAAYKKARQKFEEQLAPCGDLSHSGVTGTVVDAAKRGKDCFPARQVSTLPPRLAQEVMQQLSKPHHYLAGAEWKGRPALNPNLDLAAIEEAYFDGIAVIDNFLTDEAVQELHRLGVQSTIWNQVKAGGYLGSYPREDGFAPSVVAQLALDLEAALPNIFQAHTLLMFWGFKHDTVRAPHGIKAHADTAAINLNFWATPDSANRNPESGGLVVYSRRENRFRTFKDYNSYDVGEVELGLTPDDILARVPYRQNRAVLFSSTLYHATDTVEFHPGFENCRINYTLLFGFMEATRCEAAYEALRTPGGLTSTAGLAAEAEPTASFGSPDPFGRKKVCVDVSGGTC